MGEKLAKLVPPILIDESVPVGTVLFLSPRKYTEVVAIRRSRHGITGTIERQYEPESDWAQRCAVIHNIGVV